MYCDDNMLRIFLRSELNQSDVAISTRGDRYRAVLAAVKLILAPDLAVTAKRPLVGIFALIQLDGRSGPTTQQHHSQAVSELL